MIREFMDLSPRNDGYITQESYTPCAEIEKEHMFDKVVTPSDVGKLNRLVIPKQHAEKYFPLDSSTSDKGLLLNFEDRNGKPWRFRYSYWNSSQSYVMTKGWSRFVKEKKLDAGDIVSFQRGAGESGKDRLYIDWRRRPNPPEHTSVFPNLPLPHHQLSFHRSAPWGLSSLVGSAVTSSTTFLGNPYQSYGSTSNHPYGHGDIINSSNYGGSSVFLLRSSVAPRQLGIMENMEVQGGGDGGGGLLGARRGVEPVVFDSVPVVHGNKAAAKKFRLFGVNMECPDSESSEPSTSSLQPPQISATTSQYPSHELRVYDGWPLLNVPSKDKASSMSLDLEI